MNAKPQKVVIVGDARQRDVATDVLVGVAALLIVNWLLGGKRR